MFGTFCDIATNPEANEAAAAFIRSKIAEIVKDPETARKLTPTDLYAKRPLCNEGYYETFNRDNVTLVSIKENPIEEITPAGVRTADGVEHELDVLVFATGFDAVDGNYRSMDLRGRGGRHIDEHWTDGPTSYLGLSTAGFPNMFMILGPNGPFTNLPPSIEAQVDWISELIRQRRAQRRCGIGRADPRGRGRLDGHLRGDRQHDALPEGRLVDLRRQHPGQEERRHVLHGRHRRLPAAARRGRRRRLRGLRADPRERARARLTPPEAVLPDRVGQDRLRGPQHPVQHRRRRHPGATQEHVDRRQRVLELPHPHPVQGQVRDRARRS